MGAEAHRDCDGVGEKWNHPLGLGRRQLEAEATIEYEQHAILATQVRLKVGNPPAFQDNVVVLEGADELQAEVRHPLVVILAHI